MNPSVQVFLVKLVIPIPLTEQYRVGTKKIAKNHAFRRPVLTLSP